MGKVEAGGQWVQVHPQECSLGYMTPISKTNQPTNQTNKQTDPLHPMKWLQSDKCAQIIKTTDSNLNLNDSTLDMGLEASDNVSVIANICCCSCMHLWHQLWHPRTSTLTSMSVPSQQLRFQSMEASRRKLGTCNLSLLLFQNWPSWGRRLPAIIQGLLEWEASSSSSVNSKLCCDFQVTQRLTPRDRYRVSVRKTRSL